MAFITEFNLKRIITNCDLKDIEFNCQIFNTTRIFILSNLEAKRLQAVQEFLRDGKYYIQNYYKPIEKSTDTQKYIYEGGTPSYHASSSCESLHSDYKNYEIPIQIKERGLDAVEEFRKWFKSHEQLLDNDPKSFNRQCEIRWNTSMNIKSIEKKNTGVLEFKLHNKNEIVDSIYDILRRSAAIYKASKKNTAILGRYSKSTGLAYKSDRFELDTGFPYSKEEVIDFLRWYDKEIKEPLKAKLIDYYRAVYNPDMEVDCRTLELLGFKPCPRCHNSENKFTKNNDSIAHSQSY